MLKICILDAKTLGNDVDLSAFGKLGEVLIYQTTSPEEVIDRIKDQEVLVTNKVELNEANLKHAPNIKLISVMATGTNNIDMEYTKINKIPVTNVAGYSTQSVAQHTFAILLNLMEQLTYYDKYVKSGEYAKSDIFSHLGRSFRELDGKVWGIIGLGAIGRSVANIAKAFGCSVIYYSTSGKNNSDKYRKMELEGLLRASDVVSIHAPLNQRTQDLISYDRIKMMKKHAILLNLGRGGIVNEAGLARALDENLIAGAALDVLEQEPVTVDNPLLSLKSTDKLLITPHIAWASLESRIRLIDEVAMNIEAFLKGEERNRVC